MAATIERRPSIVSRRALRGIALVSADPVPVAGVTPMDCGHESRRGRCGTLWILTVCWFLVLGGMPVRAEVSPAAAPRFEQDVLPILRKRCEHCHGPDERESNLDVQSIGALLRGGTSGPVIVPGEPEQSILMDVLSHGDMPPEKDAKLSPGELTVIRRWIADGVEARRASSTLGDSANHGNDRSETDRDAAGGAPAQHWAFTPLPRPAPRVGDGDSDKPRAGPSWPASEIDRFLVDRLHDAGLSLSPPASPARLLRRVHIDLTGLPPSPGQLADFERDSSPHAYAQLVDRLLASPEFGARWGRFWLDWVGYTDTISFDSDMGPPEGFFDYKWRYRDYVIHAFNEDKPYDQMIRQQLAGDEMVAWRGAARYTPDILDALTATGFLRCSEDLTGEDRRPFTVWSVLHDTMTQIGTGLMGVSLTCARCHSHKFEPVSQQDYYSMMALLTPALNPENWKTPRERAIADIPLDEQSDRDCWNLMIDKRIESLGASIARVNQPYERAVQVERLRALGADAHGEEILPKVLAALDQPTAQRDAAQRQILIKYETELKVSLAEVEPRWSTADAAQIRQLQMQIRDLRRERREYGWIHAVYDVGPPPATRLLQAGSHETPRREVAPGFPRALAPASGAIASNYRPASARSQLGYGELAASLHDGSPITSGRRLRLATWLTDPQSPAGGLVARVMVNRVWEHLLGQGLVHPSDNLGMSGSRPTHPELLEWLAVGFVRDDWSIKRLIRRMVMTDAYRQSSSTLPAENPVASRGSRLDPDNQLLWRARLRRIEAESLRDTLLQLGGQIVLDQGGPPVPLHYSADGYVDVADQGLARPGDGQRRSLYLLQRRISIPSFLMTFDKPAVTGCVTYRDDGAVPLQSLTMLNDRLVLLQSRRLADQVAAAAPGDSRRQLELLYRLVYCRSPAPEELAWSLESLTRQVHLHRDSAPDATTDESAGNEPGSLPRDPSPAGAAYGPEAMHRSALAGVCQALLGSSEFLYLE